MRIFIIISNIGLIILEIINIILTIVSSFYHFNFFGVALFYYPLYFTCTILSIHIVFILLLLTKNYLLRVKQLHRINTPHLAYYCCTFIVTSFSFILFKTLFGTIWKQISIVVVNIHYILIDICVVRIICVVICYLISTHININQLLPQLTNNIRCELVVNFLLHNNSPNPIEEHYLMNKKIVWRDIINRMILDKESLLAKNQIDERETEQKSKQLFDNLHQLQTCIFNGYETKNESFQTERVPLSTVNESIMSSDQILFSEIDHHQIKKSILKRCFYEEETNKWFDEMFKKDIIEIEDCISAIRLVDKKKDLLKRKVRDKETISIALSRIIDVFGILLILIIICLINGVPISSYLLPSCTFFLGFSFIFGNYMKRVWESLVLVIFIRPFDIGDRIQVTGFPAVIIDEVQLLSTVAHNPNGEQYILPNDFLYNSVITQLKRSPFYTIELYINVDITIDFKIIEEIRVSLEQFVKTDTTFKWNTDIIFSPVDVTLEHKINFLLWIEVNNITYNDPGKYLKAKKMIIELLTNELVKRNVIFTLPKQRLVVDLKTEK
ncbi:small-conductance mechanosensitive ion channel, putative [Entamoeba histolytica HM-3:IMSS]|uniref:Small-conductance mechanosensitive ion channel, putative n=1 Tax=Entamoeba histolytica HM-3:IMSS TaxID=885315 RepID=M7WS37_ENTHI|nr:small-conductance mechanosensitive ion channel, putative [Entamoeba histolytica HM-3:IMSS]